MKFLAVAAAALAIAAYGAQPAAAESYKPSYGAKKSVKKGARSTAAQPRRRPQVAGFRLRGGYANQEYDPYLYSNGGYGFYPQFDNKSFSERVFDGPVSYR